MENKKNNTVSILEDIDEFDDYVERLNLSNELGYDEDFHKTVLSLYRDLVLKIKNSDLSVEDKAFMIEMVAVTFTGE